MADSQSAGGEGPTTVGYAEFPDAWGHLDDFLRRLVDSGEVRELCEVGGGANPALTPEAVAEHGLSYTIIDVSADELAKAPAGYRKLQADVASPDFACDETFDAVFSRTVLEHVSDPEHLHRNVLRLLKEGGVAFHFFPTLYALPFVVNRVLPQGVLEALLLRLQPHRDRSGAHRTFPALYAWCRGPTRRQIGRFERLGYVVEEYTGFFGHDYYRSLPPSGKVAAHLRSTKRGSRDARRSRTESCLEASAGQLRPTILWAACATLGPVELPCLEPRDLLGASAMAPGGDRTARSRTETSGSGCSVWYGTESET